MRPTISSVCALPSSSVIFSFETSRPTWPSVTLRASARPASTNFCLTSLSTTSIPAAAMVWAIWPPMVPAPTTAALNTNMPRTLCVAQRRALRRELAREADQGARERLALARPDEQRVDDRSQGPGGPVLELVAQFKGQPDLVAFERGEGDRLRAAELGIVDAAGLAHPRLVALDGFHHAPTAVGRGVPHQRALRGPAGI